MILPGLNTTIGVWAIWNLLIRSISRCVDIKSKPYCSFLHHDLKSIFDTFYKQMDVFSREWYDGCSRRDVNGSSMEPVGGHASVTWILV